MNILLLNIRFIDTYIDYVSGDSIQVFWDDSANALVVTKNGVTVTSGTNIPVAITRRGTIYNVKRETIFQTQICDGSDLVKFSRKDAFPFLNYELLIDNPSCDLTEGNIVCDLHFNHLPVSTNATTETAQDGTITVSATSSYTPIEYNLNADFSYGTGQSGVFTGVRQGKYLVYARDSKNCLGVIGVTVGYDRTYNVLYTHQVYNYLNEHIKIEITDYEFTGSSSNITATEAPAIISLRGEGVTDKFYPIIASTLTINLVESTPGQYNGLFTSDFERFRAKVSIDRGSGYVVEWHGKVLPNQHSQGIYGAKDVFELVASDGLPSLSQYAFLDDDSNKITGEFSIIEVVAWILRKIGTNLGIRCACNIYADGMDTTASDDPFDQAYVDVFRYYLLSDNPNCYDVLRYILKPFGAQIKQSNNYWWIVSVEETIAQYDYREFDYNGQYVTNGSYNPVKEIRSSAQQGYLHWVDLQQARKNIIPGFGKIELTYNLGRRVDIMTNSDFNANKLTVYNNDISAEGIQTTIFPDLTGYQLVNGTGSSIEKGVELFNNGGTALSLSVTSPGGYIVSRSHSLKTGINDQVNISIRFKITSNASYSQIVTGRRNPQAQPYIRLRILVQYGDYFLRDDGTWDQQGNNISYFLSLDALGKYQEFTVLAYQPDETFIDGADIYVKIFLPHIFHYEFSTVAALKAKLTDKLPINYKTELNTSGLQGAIRYYELRQSTDAADDNQIIRPTDYNINTNPVQWLCVHTRPGTTNVINTVLFLDYIKVQLMNNGNLLPETALYKKTLADGINTILQDEIHHGSLFSNGLTGIFNVKKTEVTNDESVPRTRRILYKTSEFQVSKQINIDSGDLAFCGFLRNASGTGFTFWARDGADENLLLEEVHLDRMATQYKDPYGKITAMLFSHTESMRTIDTIKDTIAGSNKIYTPVALTIDLKNNAYDGEFVELKNFTNPLEYAAGFSMGFSIGFNS